MTRSTLLAWSGFTVLVLIWGSTFLAIRVSNLEGYDPYSAVLARVVGAGAILLLLVAFLRLPLPRGRDLAVTLGAGVLIFGVNFLLLYLGEETVPSATAAVMWGIYPLLTAIGASLALRGREPLTARGLGGAVVALVGLGLVFRAHLRFDAPIQGFAMILTGITVATLAALATKRWAGGVHPLVFNAVGTTAGVAALLALIWRQPLELPPTGKAWAALAFLTLAGSVVAFPLWAWLLHQWPATRLSFQTVLSPLVAVVLGALVLHEAVTPDFAAGAALVLLGTFVATRPGLPVEARPTVAATPPKD